CVGPGSVRGASWGSDGTIIFATVTGVPGLWRVPDAGGTPEPVARPDRAKGEQYYVWPEILPGGRAVLFSISTPSSGSDSTRIAVRDLTTGQTTVLIQGGSSAHYAPSDHLVYASAGSLRAVPFDVDRLKVHGNPVPVIDHAATKGQYDAASFAI